MRKPKTPEQKARKKEADKEYRIRNRESLKEKSKKYREENPDYFKKYHNKWNKENPDYHKDYSKEWINNLKETNPKKYKELILNIRVSVHNLTSVRRLKGKAENIDTQYLKSLYLNEKNCSLCGIELSDNGREMNGKQIDHIIPIASGGSHTLENIRIVCKRCNIGRAKLIKVS